MGTVLKIKFLKTKIVANKKKNFTNFHQITLTKGNLTAQLKT